MYFSKFLIMRFGFLRMKNMYKTVFMKKFAFGNFKNKVAYSCYPYLIKVMVVILKVLIR